jgi:hypothetical protein
MKHNTANGFFYTARRVIQKVVIASTRPQCLTMGLFMKEKCFLNPPVSPFTKGGRGVFMKVKNKKYHFIPPLKKGGSGGILS